MFERSRFYIPRRSPASRRLRVYAFDPSLSWQLKTAFVNQLTLKVPWEVLGPGPVGEYLEVVDVDPASGYCYLPVDLEDPGLLAQDGIEPDESDPQFHQQMVYAVAMTTIHNFERALGRRILWTQAEAEQNYQYVRRLRIYPHALREANAYYSPQKKALLFGYFPASANNPGLNLPGTMVFSCLSHDIIAHEVTHAILDGMRQRFLTAANEDTLALHEAFADIVALLQHFTFPSVLRHQIALTRGDLASQNLLGQLAQQLGQALGSHGALRDALGSIDPETRRWRPREPDPMEILTVSEPHERGAILVAAVFEAFLAIYKDRVADLLRLATAGTGILPAGDISPDLVNRLSDEAAAVADHLLKMCIRAIDFCPPLDVTFGDYLRALVTADKEVFPDDERRFRIAVIEAFRHRGIYPQDVRSMASESLYWAPMFQDHTNVVDSVMFLDSFRDLSSEWLMESDRQQVWKRMQRSAAGIHAWFTEEGRRMGKGLGLALSEDAPYSIQRSIRNGLPRFEVHTVRPMQWTRPDGRIAVHLVAEITQRRRGYFDPELQEMVDQGKLDPPPEDFWFRGGCTLIIDLETRQVRYCILKDILNAVRLEEQRRFLGGQTAVGSLRGTYFGPWTGEEEPFAALHQRVD